MAQSPEDPQKEKSQGRKAHKKGKGGCITCKTRRVKCGEEKPGCTRCLRGGYSCQGYPSPKEPSKVENPRVGARRLLLPKNFSDTASTSEFTPYRKSTAPDQHLMSFPSQSRFKSQEDHRFHQLFCYEVAEQLSGFLPINVWRHCVLQTAEVEPFIFDAVIAIGALHNIITEAKNLNDVEAHRRYNQEHKFALERYHDSLRNMRRAIQDGSMELRTALIACLLTVCFDNLYGSRDSAIFSMLSGVKLAKQIGNQHENDVLTDPSKPHPTALSVEKELVAIFTRLDVTSMILIDYRSFEEHRAMKDRLDQAVQSLPSQYFSLEEASHDGEIIMARCWHFMNIVQGLDPTRPYFTQHTDTEPNRWKTSSLRYGWNPWSDSDEPVPSTWLEESERCVHEIQHWLLAFHPLLQKFQSSATKYPKHLLRATLLTLQAKSTMIFVRGAVFRREKEWDAEISGFQEVVTLAETLLGSQPKRFYTSFERDTLVILTYVVCKCRDGSVRRRALRLIDEYPRREATCDSTYCGKQGRWMMEIEEGGRGSLECSEITEEQRLRAFALDYDTAHGTMQTWACRATTAGEGVKYSFLWN